MQRGEPSRGSSLAADPLRPSAERAEPDAVTSDAPCRATTLARALQPLARRSGSIAGPAPRRHARARSPRCWFRAGGLVARGAFHRIDAWHRCQAGLACACWFAHARSPNTRSPEALLLRRHAGAADPCYPARPPEPLRAPRAAHRKMSLTDFCNRSTTRAPTEPLDSPPAAPRDAFGAGGDTVDAVLQLRSPSRRSPDGWSRRGAPAFRTGAAPWPACSAALDARSSTSDAPCHGPDHPAQGGTSRTAKACFRRDLVKGHDLRNPERLPSPVLARRPLAQVAGELPSTSAITTVPEHDPRISRNPARLAGGCPPARRSSRATTRLAARSGSSNPGPGAGGGLSARQRLPGDPSPGSFAPDPTCPDTSCHAPAPTPAGVARRRITDPPAGSAGAPPASGLLSPPPREEGRGPHTRGAFHREASRRRPLVFHRLSPACGFLGAAPLGPSRAPRIDVREVPP
jgi:hypothetical protein